MRMASPVLATVVGLMRRTWEAALGAMLGVLTAEGLNSGHQDGDIGNSA